MKISTLCKFTAVLAATTLAAPAFAEGIDAALDADGDGMMSFPELQVGYPDITEDQFGVMDVNGDGLLDAAEVTEALASGLLAAS